MRTGKNNSITDVPGVMVGHTTLADGDIQTGVTAILSKPSNWFREKNRAAVHVINGFGKSIGLTQIQELHTLETPILLTNTLSAPFVAHCLNQYMLQHFEEIGGKIGTVNPVVLECNDGYLNNIRKQMITEENVFSAINNASVDFKQGSVGAGRGMSCYQLKGGIGSVSSIITIENSDYTIGCLTLCNMGALSDLRIEGVSTEQIMKQLKLEMEHDKGSIIIIIATDLPLESHQLKRVVKRAAMGLSRTGSIVGHGSGDIVLGFTTSDPIKSVSDCAIESRKVLHDDYMEDVFRTCVEVVEASIVKTLMSSDDVTGFMGHNRKSLKKVLKRL